MQPGNPEEDRGAGFLQAGFDGREVALGDAEVVAQDRSLHACPMLFWA